MNNDYRDDLLGEYLRNIRQYPLLTISEEKTLSERARKGDKQAAQRLVHSNLRLVVRIAKAYQATGIPLLDLIQEGNIGLMKAVERYNYRKGSKFSSYSSWWIKSYIGKMVSNHRSGVRIPPLKKNILIRFRRERPSNLEKFARENKLSGEELSFLLAIDNIDSLDSVRLSHSEGEGMEGTLHDVIRDRRETVEDKSLYNVFREELDSELKLVLKPREYEIMKRRFGLNEQGEHILDEVGRAHHLSKQRIKQIEKKAIQKLKRSPSFNKMSSYLEA